MNDFSFIDEKSMYAKSIGKKSKHNKAMSIHTTLRQGSVNAEQPQ